jgi:HSP20 family protein
MSPPIKYVMSDSIGRLERLGRELGNIASQLTQVKFSYFSISRHWEPAINAYRCGDRFIICVDIAGVEQSAIHILAEPRRLTIRGQRPPPGPPCDQSQPVHVLDMEIDYGSFERILELPAEIDPESVEAEYREGLLWVSLPLRFL